MKETWYHSHITLWIIMIVLLLSLIATWNQFTFMGSAMRAICAAIILLRTIRKEKERRQKHDT